MKRTEMTTPASDAASAGRARRDMAQPRAVVDGGAWQPRALAVAVRRARLFPIMLGAGLSLAGTLFGSLAQAAEEPPKNFGIDIKVTAESEDDRDLGTAHGGDLNGIGLDLRPWAFGQWGNWSAYVMGQAVAATDTIQTDTLQSDDVNNTSSGRSDNKREPDDAYLALREFWVDYAGLTQYPGEHLRFGRQRLREGSGMWQDTNIEALNWTFDTTLLRAHLGAAQRFSDYRTDITDLAPEDKDRTHVFGDISTQWMPQHWVGLRLHHSDDSGSLPDPGDTVDSLDKRSTGDLTWVGIEANGDGYNWRSQMPINYWASATWLTGNRDRLTTVPVNGERIATGKQSGDVDAYGADLGLRWNIDEQWRVGGAYARGSGGGKNGEDQFEQTGLESNRSNFTGTRARAHRFGEAFRGELSNLEAATLFGSWQLRDDYDASVIYNKFRRVDSDSDIGNSGINAPLVNDSKDIGQEVDLVVTKYFKQGLLPASMSQAIDEPSALIRFRGGLFKPGDAYGSRVDSTMHHAFIDVIWRF